MPSQIFLGPPGSGKTTLQARYPGRIIDPETSIDWRGMDAKHSLYPHKYRRLPADIRLEHELDWPTVWIEEVLPRIRTALLLEKDLVMGLITPTNAELVTRFLEAFPQQTTLILPNESRHFLQTWQQTSRRPRTWGPELMGWQGTFAIRLLLQGLAMALNLPIVEEPALQSKPARLRPGTATRECFGPNGNLYIEAFHGRWAEISNNEEIVAMHRETPTEGNALVLRCDQSGKACRKQLHRCEQQAFLTHDIHGHKLNDWIPYNKLTPASPQHKNAVLFFTGTLAPFHRGHLATLNAAKHFLETRGWNVMGGYASPLRHLREGRVGALDDVLAPVSQRDIMVELGVMSSDWIMADRPTDHVLHTADIEAGTHPTQRIVQRLRRQHLIPPHTPVTTFWVNEKDAILKPEFFTQFAIHAEADPLNPLQILIVDNRPGENAWSQEAITHIVPNLLPFVTHCSIHEPYPTSATAVREALLTADRIALRETVGLPLVEAYLMGLMHKQTLEPA